MIRDVLARHGADIADIPGKDQRPDLYYVTDGHWNAKGHALAAERVLDYFAPEQP